MTQAHAFLFPGCAFQTGVDLAEKDFGETLTRHLKALRIREGESVSFLDGTGHIADAVCSSSRPYIFRVNEIERHAPQLPALRLYLSPPRRDTLSQTLSQATEMGVSRITFLTSEHNDYSQKERSPLLERSRRVVEAAIEQCRAPYLPQLDDGWSSLKDALGSLQSHAFFADEDLSRGGVYGPTSAMDISLHVAEISLFVGPEGGWSAVERRMILDTPLVIPLGLGPRILKVPTACVAALYQLRLLADAQRGPR